MNKNLLQSFNPSGKLFLNLVFLMAALFSSSYSTSIALLGLLISTGVFCRAFKWKQLPVLLPFCLFSFSLIWMNGLWGRTDGDNIITVYGVVFSEAGIRIGTLLALRVLIIILAGMLFTMSSPPQALVLSLMQQLSLPPGFAYAILAILNNLSEIKRDRAYLNASCRMRKERRFGKFRSLIPLLAINIRRCERISLAMEARGFDMMGKRTYYRKVGWEKRDTIFLLSMLLFIFSIFLTSYLKGVPIGYARWEGYR